jgi:hypothetical protein
VTREEARIVLLEAVLDQAVHLIEFLHGCLTSDDIYEYAYPEQTLAKVASARELVPERPVCVHGRRDPGCASCVFHVAERGRQAEARAVLGDDFDGAVRP